MASFGSDGSRTPPAHLPACEEASTGAGDKHARRGGEGRHFSLLAHQVSFIVDGMQDRTTTILPALACQAWIVEETYLPTA